MKDKLTVGDSVDLLEYIAVEKLVGLKAFQRELLRAEMWDLYLVERRVNKMA